MVIKLEIQTSKHPNTPVEIREVFIALFEFEFEFYFQCMLC
jgi:hypothetical protein